LRTVGLEAATPIAEDTSLSYAAVALMQAGHLASNLLSHNQQVQLAALVRHNGACDRANKLASGKQINKHTSERANTIAHATETKLQRMQLCGIASSSQAPLCVVIDKVMKGLALAATNCPGHPARYSTTMYAVCGQDSLVAQNLSGCLRQAH